MGYWFFLNKIHHGLTLIHIDTHEDCSYFRNCDRNEMLKLEKSPNLEQFIEYRYYNKNRNESCSPIRYGNWIPAINDLHPCFFKRVLLICHNSVGPMILKDLPYVEIICEKMLSSLIEKDSSILSISFDVDYYFKSEQDKYLLRKEFSDPLQHFHRFLKLVKSNSIPLFIALSPQCCGGWGNVLPFIKTIDDVFKYSLRKNVKSRLK